MVRLTKIESSHSALRTDTVEGEIEELPTLNNRFKMFVKPLEAGMFRYITTSPVQKITRGGKDIKWNVILFETLNSKYKLEALV